MTTEKKREANRKNAQKSTGPRTQRGRSISRLNAVTHGLSGKFLFVNPGHDDEEKDRFEEILKILIQEQAPVGLLETRCLSKIAECMIREERAARAENGEIRKRKQTDRIEMVCIKREQFERDVNTVSRDMVPFEERRLEFKTEQFSREVDEARRRLRRSALGLEWLSQKLKEIRDCIESGQLYQRNIQALSSAFGTSPLSITTKIFALVDMDEVGRDHAISQGANRHSILSIIDSEIQDLSELLQTLRTADEELVQASEEAAYLPDAVSLCGIVRYRGAITREMYRAFQQLNRLQRDRTGRDGAQTTSNKENQDHTYVPPPTHDSQGETTVPLLMDPALSLSH